MALMKDQQDKTGRQVRISALLLLMLMAIVVAFAARRVVGRLQPVASPSAPALAVETLRLAPTDFTVTRRYTGSVAAVNRVMLPSQVSARVQAVRFRAGDDVEQGDLLIKLDDVELRADMQRLEAAEVRIKADLSYWRMQLQRDQSLLKKKTISQKQRDDSLRMVKTLEASLEENRHALDITRTHLEYSNVYAPFSGRLQQVLVEVGDQATPGKPLLELVSLQSLKAVVNVPQQDLMLLELGQEVVLHPTAQQEPAWQSTLQKIYPVLDPSTRNATFEVPVPAGAHKLLPGMGLQAVVTIAHEEGVLTLPHQALLHRKQGDGVFVVQAGLAHWRGVEPGADQNGSLRVLSGLAAGDEVIITPDPRIQENAEVSVHVTGALP